MTFRILVIGACVALAACGPQPIPDSGAGVGFGDYAEYELERARREAALRGELPADAAPQDTASATQAGGPISTEELAAAGIGPDTASQSASQSGATTPTATPSDATIAAGRDGFVEASPQNAAPTVFNNPGISDEQDFGAVASRETIQSDAERRLQQQAAYEVVAPTAVPQRPGSAGPNIVEYALQTSNLKGQQRYDRLGLSSQNRFQRNCAKYNSPDAAQRAFLARGGPDRDRLGIDPDGDGFACAWDPAPFRLAAQTASATSN